MKKLLPISVIAIFAVAPTFADNITASSTCTNGVLGTYTGPADIEANFDPNTINTTWYNNGTAMSGNGVPSSCTYAAPLTPPTPAPRAGYVFAGWRLRSTPVVVPEPVDPFATLNPALSPASYSAFSFDVYGECASDITEFSDHYSVYDTAEELDFADPDMADRCWCQLSVELDEEHRESFYVLVDEMEGENCLAGGSNQGCQAYCEYALANDSQFRVAAYNTLHSH